jgi:hypothetical protein
MIFYSKSSLLSFEQAHKLSHFLSEISVEIRDSIFFFLFSLSSTLEKWWHGFLWTSWSGTVGDVHRIRDRVLSRSQGAELERTALECCIYRPFLIPKRSYGWEKRTTWPNHMLELGSGFESKRCVVQFLSFSSSVISTKGASFWHAISWVCIWHRAYSEIGPCTLRRTFLVGARERHIRSTLGLGPRPWTSVSFIMVARKNKSSVAGIWSSNEWLPTFYQIIMYAYVAAGHVQSSNASFPLGTRMFGCDGLKISARPVSAQKLRMLPSQ